MLATPLLGYPALEIVQLPISYLDEVIDIARKIVLQNYASRIFYNKHG